MIVAYDKNKNRVHIDDAIRENKYYCPTCGEELSIKRGEIRVHHFSHLSTSSCDGWHYDMSEWHSSWQNQFPLESQEIIFEVDGQKHRADVFINNTVIEFQHSKISTEEFNERNSFYTSLGYKVIWIFDATDAYLNREIETRINKDNFRWNNPLIQLPNYDAKKIDVYLQEFNNIWISTPNYKEISINNDELEEYSWLHHIDSINLVALQTFYSNSKQNIYDYEFVNQFVPVKFLNDGSFNTRLEMKKKNYVINDISDEIFALENHIEGRDKFIWCPSIKHFIDPYDCHGCIHLSEKNDRCKFRFEKLLSKNFDRIINIDYSDEGKVRSIIIIKDKKRYKVKYDSIPKCILTIQEAFEDKKNTQVIRVRNINTGWKAQINKYNYNMMLKNNKCYGKVQGPEIWNMYFSQKECEIFSFNKKEWELIWRK